MKKELDKELYPDYEYPKYTPDLEKPYRESIAKLGKKITDRIPQKLGLKKICQTHHDLKRLEYCVKSWINTQQK